MSDGKVEIGIELDPSKAESQANSAGQDVGKKVADGVESGLKGVDKAVQSSTNNMKSSLDGVGDSAKSSFGDVSDAAKTASGDAASAFENIPADAQGAFSDVSSQAESGMSGVADAANSASADAADSFSQVGDAAEAAFNEVGDAAQGAGDQVNGVFGTGIPTSTAIAAAAVGAVTAATVELAKEAVQTGMEFDSSMSQVAATMGKPVEEVQDLRDFAQEMGETTAFSASQSADALNYMALAGYDAETSMRVLPTVLNLAAAGSMDLAAASDMVTDAQSALGLSVEQAEVMVDQMAKASSKTNTSVSQLGSAFLTVGGTAKNLKGGTKELAQMLGILADNGIKGSEGGTALRNMILSLSAPTDKAAKTIKKLGVEVFDSSGKMRSMPEIFGEMNAALSKMSDKDKTQALNEIFNKVDLKSANALLGTSAKRFDEVAGAIDNAQGAAQQMADTQLDNLAGDVTLLESATEGFQIAVSDQLTPALRGLTQFGTNTVMPFLTGIVKNFDKVAPAVLAFVGTIMVLVAKSKLVKVLGGSFDSLRVKVAGSTAAFKAMSFEMKATAIASRVAGTALKALKTAAPVLIVTALVEGLSLLVNHMQEAKKRAEDFRAATKGLEDAATKVNISISKESDSFNSLNSAIEGIDIDQLLEDHKNLADAITDSARAAAISISDLEDYGDAISRMVGENLDEMSAADLQVAIDGINEKLGTSYEVSNKAGDGYQIYADGVKVAKDEILKLIDAEELQLQKEATREQRAQVKEQLVKDQEAYAKATEAVTQAQARLAEAEANLDSITIETGESWESYQGRTQAAAYAVDTARDSLNKLTSDQETAKATLDSTQSSYNRLEEQLSLVTAAADEGASKFIKAAAANEGYKQGVQATGTNLTEFTDALRKMGVTSEQMGNISTEQAIQLAHAWKSGYEDMSSAAESVFGEIPSKLAAMGEEAYNAAYGTGQNVSEGEADGAKSKQGEVTKAIDDTNKKVDEKQKKAAKDSKKNYEKVGTESAEGISKNADKPVKETEKMTKESVDKTKNVSDAQKSGQNLVQGFINGIKGLAGNAVSAVGGLVNSVLNKIKSVGGEHSPWTTTTKSGIYAAQGLINGLKKKKSNAKKTAGELSQIIVDEANKRLTKLKKTHDVSLKQEIAYWKEVVKATKKGSKARAEANQKVKEAQKKANDTLIKAEKTFKDEVAKIQKQLAKDTQAAWDNYNQTVQKRAESILSSFNLFDRFRVSSQRSAEVLIENMRTQKEAAEEYAAAMQTLKSKIGDGDLYQEIASQGVDALGQIRTINAMTADELKEYTELYAKRNAAAMQEAKDENKDLLAETQKTVKQLNDTANKDIKKAAQTLAKTASDLGTKTAKSVKKMATSISKSSKDIISSINASIKAIEKLNKKTATKKSTTSKTTSKAKTLALTSDQPIVYDAGGAPVGIARTMAIPSSQIEDSIVQGIQAITLAATQAASTNRSYNQTVNINQPIATPDELARTMRMQEHYGLAGRF